jgi:hypothetical protein
LIRLQCHEEGARECGKHDDPAQPDRLLSKHVKARDAGGQNGNTRRELRCIQCSCAFLYLFSHVLEAVSG